MAVKGITKTALKADGTLVGLVYDAAHILDSEDVSAEGLQIKDLKNGSSPLFVPTLYLNWTTDSPTGLRVIDGHMAFVNVLAYDYKGYANTRAILKRVKALLDQQMLSDGDGYYWFSWAGDLLEQKDEGLGNAAVERSRYQVIWRDG